MHDDDDDDDDDTNENNLPCTNEIQTIHSNLH